MRKIQTLTLAALLILGLSGCEKWLEATSSSQISGEQLFSERAGFHEALSGVYMLMGSGSCYGRNYTWFVNRRAPCEPERRLVQRPPEWALYFCQGLSLF